MPARPNQNYRRVLVLPTREKIRAIPRPQLVTLTLTLRRLNPRQQIVPNQYVPTTTRHVRANRGRVITTTPRRHPLPSRRLVRANPNAREQPTVLVSLDDVAHLQTKRIRQLLLVCRKNHIPVRVLRQIIRREIVRRRKRLPMTRRHANHQTADLTARNRIQLLTHQPQMRRRRQPTHILNILRKRRYRLLAGNQLRQQFIQRQVVVHPAAKSARC